MNTIRMLSSLPWIERLGWTLLHFLWQGFLVSLMYAGVRRAMARLRPDARYAAACLSLGAMVVAPIATFVCLGRAAEPMPPLDATARILQPGPPATVAAVFLPAFARTEPASPWISQAAPWIVAIWILGASLFCLRLAGGWWVTTRIRWRQTRPAPHRWQQDFAALRSRIRLSRPVRLLVSTRVDVPIVVGWFRPIVLMPLGALSGLPAEQVEALLLHELAHIARHDYVINLLQSVTEALLFYHPAVWWISGQIRAERELCCDDVAVSAAGDAFTYATALAGLEAYRPVHTRSALASNGGMLADRIARVLDQSRPESQTFSIPVVSSAAAFLAIATCALFGQSVEVPHFEVASVKASERGLNASGMRPLPGGRLHAENITVSQLIMSAYRLQQFQVLGGPSWIHDTGFDIEAKGAANSDRAQLMLMLQPLLKDRFQLNFHRETRELPLYVLAPSHGKANLPAPRQGGCTAPDETSSLAPGGLPPCGSLSFRAGPASGIRSLGGDVPMAELVRTLSMFLGRPVLDRTGVTARFDVDLAFTPDDSTSGLTMAWGSVAGHRETIAAAAEAAANDPKAPPNLQVALRQQLGLVLETTKGPVEVLVIERIEKPSGN